MASVRTRPSRGAFVACSPPLARIHERLLSDLDATFTGQVGVPGGDGVLSLNPAHDGDEVAAFAVPYFFSEFLSKLDDRDPSRQKARLEKTWERFHVAEESCRTINLRSKRCWDESQYRQDISLARSFASRVLGKFDWDEAAKGFSWGPGATTRLTRRESDAAYKYSGTPHATIGNAILANAVIDWSPLWRSSLPLLEPSEGVGYVKIVPGNRIVTVPKNYKTERTIAIEPDMNMYVQKGIHSVMVRKLRQAGIDLSDQSRNQRLARVGSITGRLATIDLSMASDCISRAVVEMLIRPDWVEALGQCRSPFGVLPSGEKVFYQKFSSMGNATTFELETLIFWSLALAHVHNRGGDITRISVYGDDIILPSADAPSFCGLLTHMGFTPNEKKSYWDGAFRESCGKHYFRGYDVTPFYVKEKPKTLLDLFKIHNQIWRFANRSDWMSLETKGKLMATCRWLRSYAPARWRRPSIVDGIGDGAFVGFFDEVCPKRARYQHDAWVFRSYIAVPLSDLKFDSYGLLLKAVTKNALDWDWSDRIRLDSGTGEVVPVKGQRYVEGTIQVMGGLLRRQYAGGFEA